jgi:tetratricopeptide (TPR) repeat protein
MEIEHRNFDEDIFMKRTVIILLLYIFFAPSSFSQIKQETESAKLTRQVFTLYQLGKFDEAIPLATKIVEIERNSQNKNLSDLATAMTNLARLKIEHYNSIIKKPSTLVPDKVEVTGKDKAYADRIYNLIVNYPKEIKSLLKNVIMIYKEDLQIEPPQLVSVKLELAQFLNRSDNEWKLQLEEIKEAEELFYQALSLQEKMFGLEHDTTISTILMVANFNQKNADIEKSLPLYQKFIRLVEKKYGVNSKILLPALREYVSILVTTEQENEAVEVVKKISEISGQSEKTPSADYDLSLRNLEDKVSMLMKDPNTITRHPKKQKGLYVNVLIDEKGNVLEAKTENTQEKDFKGKNLQEKASKDVFTWKFRPLIYDGKARRMRGVVLYPYFIKS